VQRNVGKVRRVGNVGNVIVGKLEGLLLLNPFNIFNPYNLFLLSP
jgi:hypothetical protein